VADGQKTMKKSLLILTTLISLCVWAYVPPAENVEQALEKGELAFAAVGSKKEIINKGKFSIEASIDLTITHCFYGVECQVGKKIQLKHFIHSLTEWEFGVNFPVGKEIIFVFSHMLEQKNSFSSNLHSGVDWAFICDGFPIYLVDNNDNINCRTSYPMGKPTRTSKHRLDIAASKSMWYQKTM